jgi:hypothetical protein
LDFLFDILLAPVLRQPPSSSLLIALRLLHRESLQTGCSAPPGACRLSRRVIRPTPVFVSRHLACRMQINAFHRARRQAQFTTCALSFDDGVQLLGGANDRIYRTRLDAQSTPNASTFVDDRKAAWVMTTEC